ncbi:ImmA/IrrE family metallo-endopeptidase [Brucella anthropi]|nr:ImmA/IrrE family metallo-endopeptidase [Brucella anthropi]KAB2756115.1 ImmA/IrrE family metallo-endopeptidase [Brucella anthropi]KAB2769053.1 ImmA/IrrE family metallo-endopeptidase [Brucella anthropi]PQZ67006.1 ImmA/IrrE family metallo-endopeptidase [Ochrobactrum sp. MYb49]
MRANMSADYVSPKPSGLSKPTVERIAEAIAETLGFRPGDSMEAVVSRFGGRIVVGTNGDDDFESGSIVARSMSDFTIYISQFTSLVRDRFTIAHELGHLLLHLEEVQKNAPNAVMRATRWVDENNQEQKRAEWEANWFAAAFLMPAKVFSEIYQKDGPSTAQRIFGVSEKAAEIRAKSIGL